MLSELGEKIFKFKYAQEGETWEMACARVANYVASAELNYNEADYSRMFNLFFQMIVEKKVLPGGRILANAGTSIKNLYNCFVLPIEDSRDGIYSTLHDAAEIFAMGGGIGYNFSNLREKGSYIKTTGGKASGPVSFMELFNLTGEVIQQASRRGAQMAMLDIDHPDIKEFIEAKSRLSDRNRRLANEMEAMGDVDEWAVHTVLANNQLSHFNMSVVVDDKFMEAVLNDDGYQLMSRGHPEYDDEPIRVPARELFRMVAEHAWESGDPGIFFEDRANEDNLLEKYFKIRATNPCGEIGLFSYEPCNLASINLCEMMNDEKDAIDLEKLSYFTMLAIRFLDNVHDLSESYIEEVNEASMKFRRVGLGVMGLADVLAQLDIPYDSGEALALSSIIGSTIHKSAWAASHYLALERGAFPAFENSEINWKALEGGAEEFIGKPIRNISVTAIAPTGSIALIADVNSGIEPFFALAYKRHITEGVGNTAKDTVIMGTPILRDKLVKYFGGEYPLVDHVLEKASETGSIKDDIGLTQEFRDVFKTANEIDWRAHVDMQAIWQPYISNSISKTINMPEEATVEDVEAAYMYAWKSGCKGITIYRNNSKFFQILNSGA